MTEQQWLACGSPKRMLAFVAPRLSPRKARLFAVACCWRVAHLSCSRPVTRAIEVGERYADGLASKEELIRAEGAARKAGGPGAAQGIANAALACASRYGLTEFKLIRCVEEAAWAADWSGLSSKRKEGLAQCHLLRDVAGNPFRPATVDPSVPRWKNGLLAGMAQAIYDEKRFGDLPILADALEEAGCDNADILGHCRGPGPHCRGCFVVDALLGKT
jgi:hypothetical protein